jgi:hypothetical protein
MNCNKTHKKPNVQYDLVFLIYNIVLCVMNMLKEYNYRLTNYSFLALFFYQFRLFRWYNIDWNTTMKSFVA